MERLDLSVLTEGAARLAEGALAFREREYAGGASLMPGLARGQRPRALVIGCMDSRVDPAHVLGVGPGDAFVVRNVANLVPPYDGAGPGGSVRAAVEFAVRAFDVRDIVVLGHARCAGVAALVDAACGREPPDLEFLGPWLELAGSVCGHALADLAAAGIGVAGPDGLNAHAARVERRSVSDSIANLRGYPWIRERIAAGALAVHGFWFDLDDGRLWATDPSTGAFLPVSAG